MSVSVHVKDIRFFRALVSAYKDLPMVNVSTVAGKVRVFGVGNTYTLYSTYCADPRASGESGEAEDISNTYITRHLEEGLRLCKRALSMEHGEVMVLREDQVAYLMKTVISPTVRRYVEYFAIEEERIVSRVSVDPGTMRKMGELRGNKVKISTREGILKFERSSPDGEDSITVEKVVVLKNGKTCIECAFGWFTALERILPEMESVILGFSEEILAVQGLFRREQESHFEIHVPGML